MQKILKTKGLVLFLIFLLLFLMRFGFGIDDDDDVCCWYVDEWSFSGSVGFAFQRSQRRQIKQCSVLCYEKLTDGQTFLKSRTITINTVTINMPQS
jgi:hypothetical protein